MPKCIECKYYISDEFCEPYEEKDYDFEIDSAYSEHDCPNFKNNCLNMFLVVMVWTNNSGIDCCVITETKEKAQEYINKEMEGNRYNGAGYFDIMEIPKWQ